jgi:hypothetical protein
MFIACFDLFYMGLSCSYDLDQEFDKLTQVDSDQFNMLSS